MIQRFFLLLVFLLPTLVFGQNLKSYQAELSQVIVDKDVVYARNIAFSSLREMLVYQAVLDLVGGPMYELYRTSEFSQRKLRSSRFLNAVKVIKEEKQGDEFFMRIEGQVEMGALVEELHKLNLVLKTDPWQKVTVLVEVPLQIPQKALLRHLKTFHLEVEGVQPVYFEPNAQRDQVEVIEGLFEKHPQAQVLLVVEAHKMVESDQYNSIGLRIYRKAGYRQLGVYSMGVEPLAAEALPELLEEKKQGFLALFSLVSIQQNSFSEGEQAVIYMNVAGLDTPFLRSEFEARILKRNAEIKNYWLTGLSLQQTQYQIRVKRGLKPLIAQLGQTNPYFHFEVQNSSVNQVGLTAAYKLDRSRLESTEFQQNEKTWADILVMLDQEPDSVPPDEWIPTRAEVEPNNNSQQVDLLAPETLLYGRISSRADEDIFEFQPPEGAKTLTITWGRLGKTDLSPQLKLYDHNFGYLNQYNLIGTKRTKVYYRFPESPTDVIYLRIADRVGFIQGETGGFKSYRYLIKYHWE